MSHPGPLASQMTNAARPILPPSNGISADGCRAQSILRSHAAPDRQEFRPA
jgi:hypothetical protein